jgi:PAS domain S-box-containing protein
MSRKEILYLIPYLLSLTISLGVFIYTWGHRHVRGAKMFSLFLGGQIITIIGFLFELTSPNIQPKLFWDKFQWITDSFLIILPFLFFCIQYTEHKLRHPRLTWTYWLGIPTLFTLILLTDNFHHLLYPDPHLSTDVPFPDLQYNFTLFVYIYILFFVYGANIFGISLLIRRVVQPYNAVYRFQYLSIILGLTIPIFLSIFSLLGIRITPQRDITPFSLAIGNLFIVWGLFRQGLFAIVPIAREHIIENMNDPVVVLDANNRVVDMNPTAMTTLGKQISQVIGLSFNEVFTGWPITIRELSQLEVVKKEIAINDGEDIFFYDLNISPTFNINRQLVGRTIVARDVTRHKTLEAGYRKLSEELEERVAERTAELEQTAEMYRAVVEHQTEFIVRWRSDGIRTFVNEAYCRYFGITSKQALSTTFLPLVADEDRQTVEEKMARLLSGAVRAETDTHRVIKPDGTIGWQEWTDQAICDENGNLIEFQSVGRDVTDRKQAEELIIKQFTFDTLMTRLLTDFATSSYQQVDTSIENALEEIARFFGVEYVDISLVSGDKKSWNSTHHWISPELEHMIEPTSAIPIGILKWSEEKILKGESIRINSLEDYPPEAIIDRQFSEEEGAKSLLSVPIRGRENSVFGVMDIVAYKHHFKWSDGDVTHLRIIGDSIANTLERKRAEIATQKSELKHRLLFESANDSIFIMQDDRFIECNMKTLEMFGCQRQEILGKKPTDFSPPSQPDGKDSQEKARRKIDAVLGGAPQFFEWKHCQLDGTLFDAEVSLSLLNLDGEVFIQAIVRDITMRKQAEVALLQSEEKFSKAFRSSPIIITISQINNASLLEVNETFEKISGYTREEVIGRSTFELDFWENPDEREEIFSSVLANDEIRNREIRFRVKNGDLLTCLLSADLIEISGNNCIIATIEDISDRKKAEIRILRLNRLYATISQINKTIVHTRERKLLFRKICRVAIEHGQFRMAWIGLIDEARELIEPVTYAGAELGYLTNLRIKYLDAISGNGPTGTAIRENQCIICQDIATDPSMSEWRGQALQRGYRSSAAVPLREHGHVIGVLNVYAGEPNGFDAENKELLEQIGQDVSFAIDSIGYEKERKRAEENLAEAYNTTLEGWAKALELRDKETEGHSRRVTETTIIVARAMGIPEEELEHVRRGSILHDIGKMGIPDEILRKRGPLTNGERSVVLKHPTTAYNMLKPIAYLEKALDIPYCHHEKWDGSGYPRGLKGEEIPLSARIFAIIDVWDALSSDRSYRAAWPQEKVSKYIGDESEKHFDPQVVKIFLQMLEKGEI